MLDENLANKSINSSAFKKRFIILRKGFEGPGLNFVSKNYIILVCFWIVLKIIIERYTKSVIRIVY